MVSGFCRTLASYAARWVVIITGLPVAQTLPENLFNSMGVLQFVEKEIFMTFGYPANIMNDNDSKIQSAPVRGYVKKVGINWSYVSTYNIRGTAKVKGMAGTLKRGVRKISLTTNLE